MRTLASGLLLTLLAQPAQADELCSTRADPPAKLIFTSEGEDQFMTLRVGKKIEKFEFSGSVGTGLNGEVYTRVNGPKAKSEVLYRATITMDTNVNPPDEPEIAIFRDRVFWPCGR